MNVFFIGKSIKKEFIGSTCGFLFFLLLSRSALRTTGSQEVSVYGMLSRFPKEELLSLLPPFTTLKVRDEGRLQNRTTLGSSDQNHLYITALFWSYRPSFSSCCLD